MKTVSKILITCLLLIVSSGAWRMGHTWPSPTYSSVTAGEALIAGAEASGLITSTLYLPLVRRDPLTDDLGISRVELIQGVTMSNAYRINIANRAATLRVFPSFTNTLGRTSVGNVNALLTCNPGAVQVSAGPITVVQTPDEGNLSHTLNFNLPAGCLTVGATYNVVIDSANMVPETDEGNNRWPALGETSFNYVASSALNVVIVPVNYRGHVPPTADLNYVTWMPIKVFPMSQINYSLWSGGVYNFNGDLTTGAGWTDLLYDIEALNPYLANTLYIGLVDFISSDGCAGGCIAGIGFIGSPSSVTWAGWTPGDNSASPVATHEMGHNLGRYHPDCGGPGSVDNGYPYGGPGNTIIGQWGLDVATATLYNPNTNFDYMSYCDPQWTSDYTYKGVADFWTVMTANARAPKADALLISGWFDELGQVRLGPIIQHTLPKPAEPNGSYRVELLDGQGQVLVTQAFNPILIASDSKRTQADRHYGQGFRVALPNVEGVVTIRIYEGEQLVFERSANGAAPQVKLIESTFAGDGADVRWQLTAGAADTRYHVRFSPDGGETWTVLALNSATPRLSVPARLLAEATHPIVEVQATDGVRLTTLTLALPNAPSDKE